jgi:signal transduction histidine kinase
MKPLAIRVNIGFVSAVAEDQQRTAVTSQGGPPEPELPERMWRRRSGRVVAGVCGGLADHLGVRVLWVRVAIAVMAGFGGAGVAAYAMLWVFVPQESPAAEHRQTRRERQQAVALIALGIALAAAFGMISGTASGWVVVPIGIALLGVAVVWREADSDQRKRWAVGARSSLLGTGGRRGFFRVAAGVLLMIAGITVFLVFSVNLGQVQFALVAVIATLIGVAVLTLPWWLRLMRDLGDERRARIRTEERAEIAAHLHDSVLQTLALIQKQAETPREVLRLARGQERQLRTWLYGPSGYGRPKQPEQGGATATANGEQTLAEAVATASGEVEDAFAISVQQVVVGDCEMDEKLIALVQACREAMVNAAKHSGAGEVSVYAEVEPNQIAVFVRDRGSGFDEDEVSGDRHGLADSIRGRMSRNGGEVRLRTAPGEGTEVQLRMPRE